MLVHEQFLVLMTFYHESPTQGLFGVVGKDLIFPPHTHDHLRDRFLDFSGNIAIPILYGISALGTRFSVYEYTSGTRSLTPPRILPHPRRDGTMMSWN